MSDYVLYHFGRWKVRGIENGANLRRLRIYAQNISSSVLKPYLGA